MSHQPARRPAGIVVPKRIILAQAAARGLRALAEVEATTMGGRDEHVAFPLRPQLSDSSPATTQPMDLQGD